MTAKSSFVAAYMAEVVSYGGMPLRRADVYAVCLADTGDRQTADLFAFGPNRRIMDCEPLSIAEYRAETDLN